MSIKPMQLTALSFQKEGHCIVKLATNILRSTPCSWRVIAPQLMGRAVRRHYESGIDERI